MAKRELDAPGAGEELQTVKGRASDINRREERCCQVYEEGLKAINTGGGNRFSTDSLLSLYQKLVVLMQTCVVDIVFQNPCGRATWLSAWRG